MLGVTMYPFLFSHNMLWSSRDNPFVRPSLPSLSSILVHFCAAVLQNIWVASKGQEFISHVSRGWKIQDKGAVGGYLGEAWPVYNMVPWILYPLEKQNLFLTWRTKVWLTIPYQHQSHPRGGAHPSFHPLLPLQRQLSFTPSFAGNKHPKHDCSLSVFSLCE